MTCDQFVCIVLYNCFKFELVMCTLCSKILYANCTHMGHLHTELILSHEHLHVLALFSFFLALQASFVADGSADISIDDPDFWEKWAKKAHLDLDQLANKVGSFLVSYLCYLLLFFFHISLSFFCFLCYFYLPPLNIMYIIHFTG